MAPPQRYTFISDATDEFTNNKNNSFKVRLPSQLHLPRDNWYASLWSVSVPDASLANDMVFSDQNVGVVEMSFTHYKLSSYDSSIHKYTHIDPTTKEKRIPLSEVMNATHPVTSGMVFWKNTIRAMEQEVEKELLKAITTTPTGAKIIMQDSKKPTFSWQGEDLVLEAVQESHAVSAGNALSKFGIHASIAVKFGFAHFNTTTNQYELGPNVTPEYPSYEFTGSDIPALITTNNALGGTTSRALNTPDVDTTSPKVDRFTVDSTPVIYFSRVIKWTFSRLNDSFDALLNTKETVMVYSDLVQSSVVGSGRFPLLRSVDIKRTGQGRVTVEPYHREWIPVRSKTIDIVEIELATASGPLTQLSEGKTIVTVGLQQQ